LASTVFFSSLYGSCAVPIVKREMIKVKRILVSQCLVLLLWNKIARRWITWWTYTPRTYMPLRLMIKYKPRYAYPLFDLAPRTLADKAPSYSHFFSRWRCLRRVT
jgi:hypothetical protein